jgi:hypothetical protein
VSVVARSQSFQDMFTNLKLALKNIFKVQKVTFMLQDFEIMEMLQEDGIRLKELRNHHDHFNVVLSEKEPFD